MDKLTPPDRKGSLPDHPADCNALAARLGWLPFYPQFKENSLETCEKATKAGAASNEEIVAHTLERLKSGDLELSVDAPDESRQRAPRHGLLACQSAWLQRQGA